jgi:hypothetical protein
MTSYIKRPKAAEPDKAFAAEYRFGEPLDELREVARHEFADMVEVPEWRVLLVRREVIPDHSPSYISYDVVREGQMLIWSERSYSLYVDDRDDFESEWQAEA